MKNTFLILIGLLISQTFLISAEAPCLANVKFVTLYTEQDPSTKEEKFIKKGEVFDPTPWSYDSQLHGIVVIKDFLKNEKLSDISASVKFFDKDKERKNMAQKSKANEWEFDKNYFSLKDFKISESLSELSKLPTHYVLTIFSKDKVLCTEKFEIQEDNH